MLAGIILTVLSLAGAVLTTIQTVLIVAFRRGLRPFGGGLRAQASPRVGSLISILKPVCGLDDELEQNLASFVRLEGIRYEVVISIEDRDDPAVEVVQRVMRQNPAAPFRVIIGSGSRRGVVNRKVERLMAAARVARGDIFFISDSNVRVAADDIARTLEAFSGQRVGCVSNLFVGAGARSVGATIESLHLLSFVAPGAVLAAAAGVPCVVGKSMAISRRAHDAIGGFAAFRHVLAEDQAIGLAVKRAGFEVALSPVVVRNVSVGRSVGKALDRQVRWNKIRFSFSRPLYAAEIVLNSLLFACGAAIMDPATFGMVPVIALAVRLVQIAVLNRATGARLTLRQIALTPLLDALMVYGWFVPFFSNRIEWRGYHARIGRDTELVQVAA